MLLHTLVYTLFYYFRIFLLLVILKLNFFLLGCGTRKNFCNFHEKRSTLYSRWNCLLLFLWDAAEYFFTLLIFILELTTVFFSFRFNLVQKITNLIFWYELLTHKKLFTLKNYSTALNDLLSTVKYWYLVCVYLIIFNTLRILHLNFTATKFYVVLQKLIIWF